MLVISLLQEKLMYLTICLIIELVCYPPLNKSGGNLTVNAIYLDRWRMAGIERTDSVMWDPHKMLGSILQCAVLLTKHVGLLGEAHNTCAQYLFQQDKIYDVSYDTGDKSLQCGRKTDAFKLWMQWKAYGSRGLAQLVETLFDNAEYFKDQVAKEPGFELLFSDLQSVNICFWYIPKRLRGKEENEEWWQQVSKVAPAIKGEMQKRGTMMIQYQPQGTEYVNFFRMITSNPTTTHDDLNHAIKLIAEYGEELFPSE